jgi:hypothetical protein
MSHACRGTRAFAHLVVLGSRIVRNCTSSPVGATVALLAFMTALAPNAAYAIQPGAIKFEMPIDVAFDPDAGVPGEPSNVFVNPCTTETVTLSGTTEVFIYNKVQNNGGFEITLRVRHTGTGVSDTGASYNFHSEESFKFRDVPSGAYQTSTLTKTMLVRQGEMSDHSLDDWMIKQTIRLVIDDNGVMRVERIPALETSCQ